MEPYKIYYTWKQHSQLLIWQIFWFIHHYITFLTLIACYQKASSDNKNIFSHEPYKMRERPWTDRQMATTSTKYLLYISCYIMLIRFMYSCILPGHLKSWIWWHTLPYPVSDQSLYDLKILLTLSQWPFLRVFYKILSINSNVMNFLCTF